MRLALLVPLAFLTAACGATHNSTKPDAAKLLVEQTVNRGGPVPIEGAYSYVRIEDKSGSKVAEQRLPGDGRAETSLDPGSYRLVSYQRTCDGNCGTLDPASDRCSASFTASGPVSARIRVTYGSGCTVSFRPAASSS
jgi:hypothetical protein